MKKIITLISIICVGFSIQAQTFTRSELPTQLSLPWEITYGPDNYLWVTDSGGVVARIDPATGAKTIVYAANDYFPGDPSEQLQLCFMPNIGSGTLGMALDPDFPDTAHSYIYYMYSYNSGTVATPATKFKIARLKWNAASSSVVSKTDIVLDLPTGYDHLGGRLMAIKRNGTSYLFVSIGDNGISEDNSPSCYNPQTNNPNNKAQDPNFKNGKIHRFNIDGTIPADNPIPGNSFYTRGHRNPQGLMYNPGQDILYDTEHGDRIDDEINILHAGKNYGWKNVRGYHNDNNYPGEAAYISSYVPNPLIANDSLIEPIYSWCATTPSTSTDFLDWCTVAPSGGEYYGHTAIPEWTNSLLVVTLKNGVSTDQELYQFKLSADGKSIVPSTTANPNPKKYFAADQGINGRLRDIAISPDGMKIYLINNGGAGVPEEKITVYTYVPAAGIQNQSAAILDASLYPNPAKDALMISSAEPIKEAEVYNITGSLVKKVLENITSIRISDLSEGVYMVKLYSASGKVVTKRFIKQ